VFPVLNVGPAAIQLPGLLLLVGYWLALNLAGRRARSAGLSEDAVFNAGFLALLVGLIGARLGYVALHWSAYQTDLKGILALNTGAFSAPAGLLVGGGAAALFLWRQRPPIAALLDALAPALALMLVFVALANLSGGSAYGRIADLPWAIDLWGAPRHPTQVYEILAALTTLGVLVWTHPHRPYDGFTFLLFLLFFGASRLFLEAFRADPWLLDGGFRGTQLLGWGVLLFSLWLLGRKPMAATAG
jgi:phosphatidylglycerol:prolipoprotein diacylglycerol transferase